MFKSFIKLTFRKIFREKTYSLINIIGLSVGLASFIIIMLYVYDEYSYDKYHSKSDRIYRITSVIDAKGVGEESSSQPYPLGPKLLEEYPQYIENSVRFFNLQKSMFTVSYKDKTFNEKRFFYADSSVFDIFDFEIVKRKKNANFNDEFTIIITESTAEKYFEDTDPIGKKLKIDNYFEFEVIGVIKDVKSQSHFKFDFLASFSSLKLLFGNDSEIVKNWVWNPFWTYILVKDNESAQKLEADMENFVKKYFDMGKNETFTLKLQPLTDIHLKSQLDYEIEKNNNEKYVNILVIIAILILIIAAINFINLATAGAANRAKEISIKKIVGASRFQLLIQFLTESIIMAFLSLIVAISLVELFLPAFSMVSGKEITTDFRFKTETILMLISLGIFTGFLSGFYPALFLSSFKPIKLLKGNFRLGTNSTKFRKVLVFVQFSISIVLIISTIGIFKQLKYIHNADLGFEKKEIILINTEYSRLAHYYTKFKNELVKKKYIKYVTGMDYILGSSHNTYAFKAEGFFNDIQFYPALTVRDDFVKTFDIKIVEGSDLPKDETEASNYILVNEEMVSYLGLEKNSEIIGKVFLSGEQAKKVIGVFSNVNITSLHTKVEPFIISIIDQKELRGIQTKYIAIQVEPDKLKQSLADIETLWNKFNVNRPFEYKLLQDEIDSLYKFEDVLGKLARIFTILSILIASLGIWALTAFITEHRTREIGIRKALGASIFNIVKLINLEFIVIMIVANIIAWPIAYFILEYWINTFAYKADVNLWTFAFATIISFIIAIVAISHKSIEVARKDPVDSLKYE
ncbi:MAG: ABC transporter permease [Bacteroidales bacterium]|nr:ABC transporter permease [Bacteroidales bacterium]MBN2758494.1 ABC transporter permease [Bacteroidales bacterium]